MTVTKIVNSEDELLAFMMENCEDGNYSKIFNSEYALEENLFFENGIENIKNFRNKPKSYPQIVMLTTEYGYDSRFRTVNYLTDITEEDR